MIIVKELATELEQKVLTLMLQLELITLDEEVHVQYYKKEFKQLEHMLEQAKNMSSEMVEVVQQELQQREEQLGAATDKFMGLEAAVPYNF